jgi:hypothetical protein
MQALPAPTLTRARWRVLLIVGFAAWAFWGAWRVWELLLANVPSLASWRAELLTRLPHTSFAYKAIFFVLFLAAYLLWAALPAWVLLVLGIVRQERSLVRGGVRAFSEVLGTLAGTIVLLALWFGGTLFLAFFGEVIDLVGAIVILAAIVVAFVLELLTRSRAV